MEVIITANGYEVPLAPPLDRASALAGSMAMAAGLFRLEAAAQGQVKVVRSAAFSERTNVLAQALGAVGLMGALAATACTLLPKLPLQILRSPFIESAPLVPWFAWCMLPLAVANVLINNLLARERFVVVPFLLIVAVAYGTTLHYFHPSFTGVIKTLGLFGLLLVAVCVVFTLVPAKARITAQ